MKASRVNVDRLAVNPLVISRWHHSDNQTEKS